MKIYGRRGVDGSGANDEFVIQLVLKVRHPWMDKGAANEMDHGFEQFNDADSTLANDTVTSI